MYLSVFPNCHEHVVIQVIVVWSYMSGRRSDQCLRQAAVLSRPRENIVTYSRALGVAGMRRTSKQEDACAWHCLTPVDEITSANAW